MGHRSTMMEGPLMMSSPHMMGLHGGFSPFAMPPMDSMAPMSSSPFGSYGSSSSPRGTNTSVRFIEKLGAGAFGEVWKADASSSRPHVWSVLSLSYVHR